MQYGEFSHDGKEYIIERPNLPRPWFNYLFNDRYHAIISHTGGGFSYARDPKFNRILNYENYSSDRPGRYVFIRDAQSKKFWTPNWQPICEPLEHWQGIHGFGYSKISALHDSIKAELTYFVPLKEMAEHILIKITNAGEEKRDLSIFPFFDVVAGDISLELLYPNIMPLYNRAHFDKEKNSLYLLKTPTSTRPVESVVVLNSSYPVSGFDTSREKFLGRYGHLAKPLVVVNGSCSGSLISGERMVAVIQHNFTLSPGESVEIGLTLQFFDSPDQYDVFINPSHPFESVNILKKAADAMPGPADLQSIKRKLTEVQDYWAGRFTIQMNTPDKHLNTIANNWLQYQLIGITHWRGSSPYHGAEGGLGYRDTAQDAEGLLSLDLDLARRKITTLLQYQYKSGHAVSGFSDIEGPWDLDPANLVAGKSDVSVWIVYAVISYLKETGDFNFLKEEYPFLDGEKASVQEHILRAVRYLYNTTGKNKLPKIMKADWNDAYDRIGIGGKGESVWLAMALARALKQCSELFEFLGESELYKEMIRKYNTVKETVNTLGWEKDWYLAAFSDDGYEVGSVKYKQGRMPLNSQTWAILSEIVPEDRKEKILSVIDKHLDTDYGPALFSPAYSEYNHKIGRVSAFSEGTKENAAVFSHAAAFKIIADCMAGRGNKAYETYSKILPTQPHKSGQIERYKSEPYIIAEYVIGPEHPYAFGQGEFTWNTGTVPWLFTALTEWMFGVRRTFEGLFIDPCLPEEWEECAMTRPFRGDIYHVEIKNPGRKEKGVKRIWLDGREVATQIIKPVADGKEHTIKVLMG